MGLPVLDELFERIGNAIRKMDKSTGKIPPLTFPERIEAIVTGPDTMDANATANDIEEGKTAYVKGEKVTGVLIPRTGMPFDAVNGNYVFRWNPTYDSSSAAVEFRTSVLKKFIALPTSEGAYFAMGSVRVTKFSEAVSRWVPTTYDRTIITGQNYPAGISLPTRYWFPYNLVIAGDANLVDWNIRSGVSIFGVSGSYIATLNVYNVNIVNYSSLYVLAWYIDNFGRAVQLSITPNSTYGVYVADGSLIVCRAAGAARIGYDTNFQVGIAGEITYANSTISLFVVNGGGNISVQNP